MGLNVAKVVLEGELGDVALPELVQLLCAARNSREIDVTFDGGQIARLVVLGGRVVRCVAFGHVGLEAFFLLMEQRTGRYVVRIVEQASGSIHPSLAEATWESLLMEAARRQDLTSGVRPREEDDLALDGFDVFEDSARSSGSLLPPAMPPSRDDATPFAPHVAPRHATPPPARRPPLAPRAPGPLAAPAGSAVGKPGHGQEAPHSAATLSSADSYDPSAGRAAWEPPQPRRHASSPPGPHGSEWAPLASRRSISNRAQERSVVGGPPRSFSPTEVTRPLANHPERHPVSARLGAAPDAVPSAPRSRSTVEDPQPDRISYDAFDSYDPHAARASRVTVEDPRFERSSERPSSYTREEHTQVSSGGRVPVRETASRVSFASPVASAQPRRPALSEDRISPAPPSRRSVSDEGPASSTPSSQSASMLRERATEAYLRRDLHQALRLFEASLALAPNDERSKANVARIKAKLGVR